MRFSAADQRHLQAAEGWIELGNHAEANEELENITPQLRAHPKVLKLRWQIYAAANNWEATLDIASAIIQIAPEDPFGWIHRSKSLYGLKRTVEARDNLLRVVDQFPRNAVMRYDLARYECQLGRLKEAERWLQKAFEIGDATKMKLAALDDRDLEPLWRNIGRL